MWMEAAPFLGGALAHIRLRMVLGQVPRGVRLEP